VILFIIVILLLIFYLLFAYSLFQKVICREKKRPNKKPSFDLSAVHERKCNNGFSLKEMVSDGRKWLENREHKPFEIKTFDGLTLCGKIYVPDCEPKSIAVFVHGFRSYADRDRPYRKRDYLSKGFTVVEYDLRGCGKSDGKYVTYGILDRFDLRDIVLYINGLFPNLPIVLEGISMGGATVCMTAGLDLPENVKLIVADCPVADPFKQILYTEKCDVGFSLSITTEIVRLFGILFAKFDLKAVSAENEIRKSKIPLYLIHGTADKTVPVSAGKSIFENCPSSKKILIVEDADHGLSYLMNTDEYENGLNEMLNKYVCPQNPIA